MGNTLCLSSLKASQDSFTFKITAFRQSHQAHIQPAHIRARLSFWATSLQHIITHLGARRPCIPWRQLIPFSRILAPHGKTLDNMIQGCQFTYAHLLLYILTRDLWTFNNCQTQDPHNCWWMLLSSSKMTTTTTFPTMRTAADHLATDKLSKV